VARSFPALSYRYKCQLGNELRRPKLPQSDQNVPWLASRLQGGFTVISYRSQFNLRGQHLDRPKAASLIRLVCHHLRGC
jgi:hypothetical protein